jgi:hypothetical protein
MLRRHKSLAAALATAVTALGLLAVVPATSAVAAPSWSTVVCHGTVKRPGILIGTYWNVIVRGVCVVNSGPVLVQRNIWVGKGSVLLAAYGRHNSHLVVDRDIFVKANGTLLLGCEPKYFPCLDDPHHKHPTLHSHSTIFGSLLGDHALGIVVHNSWIGRQVSQLGGGGGKTCKPRGIFKTVHSPVYSDYEDNFIRGDLRVKHVRSCWFGALRNFVASNATISSNVMADPDAMEVVTNTVLLNLVCWRDSPRVQFGDSHGKPNKVGLRARFQCGFHVLKPNPAGQNVHFSHISVPLR